VIFYFKNKGTYDVEIQADEAGPHKVDLFLRNKDIPSHIEHIKVCLFVRCFSPLVFNQETKDFPKTIVVEAGVSNEKTLVHGPGLENGILDTQPAEFYIETRDSHGRPIGHK